MDSYVVAEGILVIHLDTKRRLAGVRRITENEEGDADNMQRYSYHFGFSLRRDRI